MKYRVIFSCQVDTVVKSLWPFYKQNGRKYKRHTYKRSKTTKRSHQRRRTSNALQNNEVIAPDAPPHRRYLSTNFTESNVAKGSPGVPSLSVMDDRVHDCSVNSSWEEGVGRMWVLSLSFQMFSSLRSFHREQMIFRYFVALPCQDLLQTVTIILLLLLSAFLWSSIIFHVSSDMFFYCLSLPFFPPSLWSIIVIVYPSLIY